MKKIQDKHLLQESYFQGSGYIDTRQINQELSYYISSRPNVYGSRDVYQFITMRDGTIYELSSATAATKGIVAHTCKQKGLLPKQIERLTRGAIHY